MAHISSSETGLAGQIGGLKKLLEITCELSMQDNLDEILRDVTAGACEALSCERASLFLYDESRRELFTRVATELEIEEIRSTVDSGITGWVARRRQIANIPDPQVDARWNSSVDRQTGFQTRNILAAPALSPDGERLLGVLELMNKKGGPFTEADEQLLVAFVAHASAALERSRLQNELRRQRELELAIEVGRNIQTGFLPDELPEINGYEVAAWWQPAEAVSGDYYDICPLPDGRLGLIVADVSGHGVGASLIMASVRAMLHVLTRTCSDPRQIMSLLSETITPDLKHGRFITFLMVALDPKTHEIEFSNAGHGPAFHFERNTQRFQTLLTTALPIGFDYDSDFPCGPTIRMEPGDLLLLATDGTVELRNTQGDMFGKHRLQQLLLENRRSSATEITEKLSHEITAFRNGQDQADDATLLVIERKLK